MASTKDQRTAGRRVLRQYGMKVDIVADGDDELWTPRLGEATGQAVRVTPGMTYGDLERQFGAACRVLANG